MTERHRRTFFTLLFALVLYVAGASFVESFVNYPSWRMIGANEFRAYHNALSAGIIRFMVAPWFVEIALTFVLIYFRPRVIPWAAILIAQALNLIALTSSVLIQIPIQAQLGTEGLSIEAIDRLIATDPIRWVAFCIKVIVYLWMILRLVNSSDLASADDGSID